MSFDVFFQGFRDGGTLPGGGTRCVRCCFPTWLPRSPHTTICWSHMETVRLMCI